MSMPWRKTISGQARAVRPTVNKTTVARLFAGGLIQGSGPAFTYTRSDSRLTVFDHENVLRTAQTNEMPVEGARRVENYFVRSEDFTHGNWLIYGTGFSKVGVASGVGPNGEDAMEIALGSLADGALYQTNAGMGSPLVNGDAGVIQFMIRAVSGSTTVRLAVGADFADYSGDITVDENWKIITHSENSITNVANSSLRNNTAGNAGNVYILWAQLESMNGLADKDTPSEYVSTNVLSSPYHGYGADGVKYFFTDNGNSVVSNVVTEGVGTALSSVKGVLLNPAYTNLVTHSDDFSGAGWSTAACTVTTNQSEAVDGRITMDKVVTTTTLNDNIYDVIVMATTTDYNASLYITNVDAVSTQFGLWDNTGAAWLGLVNIAWSGADITGVTSAGGSPVNIRYEEVRTGIWRVSFNATTGANTNISFLIYPAKTDTIGQGVLMGGVQATQTKGIKPLIPTTGAAASVVAPTFQTTDIAGVVFEDEGAINIKLAFQEDESEFDTGTSRAIVTFNNTAFNGMFRQDSSQKIVFYDGTTVLTSTTTVVKDTEYNIVVKWSVSSATMDMFINGVKEVSAAYDGSFQSTPNRIELGLNSDVKTVSVFQLYPEALSDAECLRLSA